MKPSLSSLKRTVPLILGIVALGLLSVVWFSPTHQHSSENRLPDAQKNPQNQPSLTAKAASQSFSTPALTTLPAIEPSPAFTLQSVLKKPELIELPPEGEPIPHAALQVISSAVINPGTFRSLSLLSPGSPISFPTSEGSWIHGTINHSDRNSETGEIEISGSLAGSHASLFTLTRKNAGASGLILDRRQNRAFLLQTAKDGRILLQEKTVQSVLCAGMPKGPEAQASPLPTGPVAALTVPALDSLPSAEHVMYLDFDGETVTDPLWPSEIDGSPTIVALPATMAGQTITEAQIRAVWDAVAEDFRPFNISVTTIASRYSAAGARKRMRCIITPTNNAAPSAGGVAYLNSYSQAGTNGYSSNIPCWSFNSGSVREMAMTISHELGHTVGLSHDGFLDSEGRLEYYGGHGTGVTSWGALMGAPFGRPVTQWSKGDYAGRTNTEDDLAIISNITNGFRYRTDDVGNSTGTARLITDQIYGVFNDLGVISEGTDVDYHRINAGDGPINVTVTPLTTEPNLDVVLELRDSNDALITTANPSGSLAATISRNLTVGVYYLVVRRTGVGNPLDNPPSGYDAYGSLGGYRFTGNFTPLPLIPTITVEPEAPPAAIVEGRPFTLSVAVLSNSPVTYQWIKIVNGVETPINGARSKSYKVPSANASHVADYKVRIVNKAGTVESNVVTVDVILRPRIVTHPANATFPASSNQALSAVVSGTPPFVFTWFKNKQPIANSNSPIFDLTGIQWSDAGSYRLEVSNSVGKAASRTAVIKVSSPPVFLSDPPLFAVASGAKATLGMKIAGSAPFSYQWLKDDQPITGATKPALQIPGQPGSTGIYKLQVTNAFGTTTSDGTTVAVDEKLVITQHPVGVSAIAGGTHTLNVETTGTAPTAFQWQYNRKDVPSATAKTQQLDPLTWFHNGRHRVVVSNRVSRVTSKEAAVVVASPPVITLEPLDQKGARGGSVTFAVKAVGNAKITYQWRKDSVNLPGATSPNLTLRRLDTINEGSYDVIATNSLGSTTSRSATLVVEDAPTIQLHPQPGFFAVGSDIILSVGASGSPALHYQWQKSNKNFPSADSPTLTIPNAQAANAGSYRVVVSNDVGKVTSKTATAKVLVPPTITVDPQPVTVFEGETATFTVKAAGTGPFTYRWFRGTTQVSTAATLRLANVLADKAGEYHVVVSNPVGSATSADATLTVELVPAPAISSFTPTQGPVGTKVVIFGSQLRFVKSVTLGNIAMPFVVINNGELLATVPASALTSVIRARSKGGTATSATSFRVISEPINDDFQDSMILTGTTLNSRVDTEDYTRETSEPSHAGSVASHSAWWRWIAPKTGVYEIKTRSTTFDTVLAIYTGNSIGNLLLMAYNDDGYSYNFDSLINFSATKGVAYRIALDGYGGRSGRATLDIRPTSSIPLANIDFEREQGFKPEATTSGIGLWQGDTESAVIASNASGQFARIGGASNAGIAEPAQIWHPAIPDSATSSTSVTSTFMAGLELPVDTTSADVFSWTLYNSEETPLLALGFSAADGSITVTNAEGETWHLEQRLVSGAGHRFEITTDFENNVWSLLFDGVDVLLDQPLGITSEAPNLKDVSAGWTPAGGTQASMFFDDLIISTPTP